MANILTYPDALSLASNLKKFVISSEADVRFKLYCGETLLIDESYSPAADGKITVDVREVVKNELSFSIPSTDVFVQPDIIKEFSAHIDTEIKIFKAIRTGVENLAVSATEFLTQNFLTWQPQSKSVGYSQPEWLTYYAPVAGNLKVKFYLSDNTTSVQILTALVAGSCVSVNMMFSRIMALQAGSKQGYFDVWVENAAAERLTYVQRYVYNETEAVDEHFLFENSLGGIDTAVMSGESVFVPELAHSEGTYEEESEQLDDTVSRLFQKSTGWKSKVEAAWLWDFFRAIRKYKVDSGVIRKITLKESGVTDSSAEDMKSFSFTYRIASDKGLLNISRSADPLPANLEITTPEGLFFLAPRLVEFPDYSEDAGLIPIQSPYIQSWFKISKGQLKAEIKQSIMIDPALSQYVLPKASDTILGGIKVGLNLTIDANGTLNAQNSYSLPIASESVLGGVKAGSNVSINASGVISVADPYSHPESHPASMIVSDTLRRFVTDTQISNYDAAYNARHSHGNKANLDTINQDLSKTSNVQFNNLIADGSIGFYGGVGSGGTPVASLLDLSDIDASISTAATGTPLVKLINGKWGPGSISIDLSNYYNKTDSDTRYAFKSHSHDYISPTTFNSHTGDTVKHLTAAERTAWNGKEPALGNPDVDGKILASTAGGVRSWVNRYVLPVAAAAILGGVMVGSNISVNAQGVISVAAPYSHPASHAASMIDTDATRRFISDAQLSNLADAYNLRHSHANKANLDTINQDLSKTSNVQFNNLIADGSIGFYGGVGSGGTPVASLLDLSDIDASISTAATGTPLVKLINGKWGAGSISIDLSNYYNKTDSDARYAFKSHSHDYISPTTFNGHTGDNVKHITGTERTNWNAAYGWGNHAGLYASESGSGAYLWNQASSAQSGNLWITGLGAFGGRVSAGSITSGAIGAAIPIYAAFNSRVDAVTGNKTLYLYNDGTSIKLDAYDYGIGAALPIQIGGNGGAVNIVGAASFSSSIAMGGTLSGATTIGASGMISGGGFQITGGTEGYGTINKNATTGFKIRLVQGSGYEFELANQAGNTVMTVANGTYDAKFWGAVIFSSTVSATGFTENGTALASKYLGISATAANSSLLDGHAASYFFRGIGYGVVGGSQVVNSSGYTYANGAPYYGILTKLGTDNDYAMQFNSDTTSKNLLAFRIIDNGNYGDWKGIWHSGNLTNTLTSGYLPYWNGTTLVNSGISNDVTYTNIHKPIKLTDNGYYLGSPTHGHRFNDNGSNYNNFIIYENGNTYTRGAANFGSYIESASYLKGLSVKLGTWEIKENAQGELEFIQSGYLRFKGTSLGLISQKTVAFYD